MARQSGLYIRAEKNLVNSVTINMANGHILKSQTVQFFIISPFWYTY